jgi:hypothetical protein
MEELDSYRMDIAVHLGASSDTMYAEVEGQFTRMYFDDTEFEFFVMDDGVYTASRIQYGLRLLERNEDLSMEGEYDDFSMYATYEFEQEDDYYVFEGGEMEGMDELSTTKLRLENGMVREIILDGYLDKEHLRVVLVFSMFNEIELDIPSYPSMSEIEAFETMMDEWNITDGGSAQGWGLFVTPQFNITCVQSQNQCFIETDPVLQYDLVTRRIRPFTSEAWWEVDRFLEDHVVPGLTTDHFEFLHTYEKLYRSYS